MCPYLTSLIRWSASVGEGVISSSTSHDQDFIKMEVRGIVIKEIHR